jgi:hypothetical protein
LDAGQLKESLTLNDMIDLLHDLGADPSHPKNNEVNCRTICHHGNKKKLVYYHDSRSFTCFTDNCGRGFDIYVLIERIHNIDFTSAFRYVAGKFGVDTSGESFITGDKVDTSFIKKFNKVEEKYEINDIPKTLLNNYYDLQHKDWINDGISIRSMKKFNILYSIWENKIIIPHFDVDNRLLGIRGRALNQSEVDEGRKYMPVYLKGSVRKHLTGANIYGVNRTKEDIKRHKTIVLFESEKSVMQLDTMFPDRSIGGAISGSYLNPYQVKILHDLGVENVVIGTDKEFEEVGSIEELFYKKKIKSGFIDKLLPYFRVSILWDQQNLLELKDAPTDKGKETFLKLWENRIYI